MVSQLLILALALSPTVKSPHLLGDWPNAPSGRRVSLHSESANAGLQAIAKAAGWNLALNTGPAGEAKVSLATSDTPVEEALAALLTAAHLDATRIGDTLVVTPANALPAAPEPAADDDDDAPGAIVQKGLQLTVHRRPRRPGGRRAHRGGAGEQLRDVVAMGGSVHVGSKAHLRNVVAIGGSVDLEPGATVERNAVAVGGSLHLAPDAAVGRDAVSVFGQVTTDPGAKIGGDQTAVDPRRATAWLAPLAGMGFALSPLLLVGSILARFVAFFGLGAILLLVAPRQLASIAAALQRRPVRAGVVGFLATVALPFLALFLVVTLVGIPLLAVEFFGTLLAGLMGWTALAVGLGEWLRLGERLKLPAGTGPFVGLAVGVAIVLLLGLVPVFGTLAWITGWFLVFGATLATRFGSVPDARARL